MPTGTPLANDWATVPDRPKVQTDPLVRPYSSSNKRDGGGDGAATMGSNAAGDDPKSIIVDAGADKKQEGGASQSASKQPGHNSDADPVLYRHDHGSARYLFGEDGKADHGATGTPRPMTKKEVSDEAENVKESGKIPDLKDLHDNFHSARSDKHRASLKGDEEQMPPIPYSTGLTTQQAEELLKVHGRNELVENAKPMWKLFVEQFTAPMPIGIWIAMIVELSLENWTDAVILFVLQCINGTVGFTEARKAGNAVAALKATLKPSRARC